ncbi:metal-dependent hydrolase [Gammaproteobacteria bacterium]|nr:metal-dependent hydrolase [Gammaproteobacteria bacterium]
MNPIKSIILNNQQVFYRCETKKHGKYRLKAIIYAKTELVIRHDKRVLAAEIITYIQKIQDWILDRIKPKSTESELGTAPITHSLNTLVKADIIWFMGKKYHIRRCFLPQYQVKQYHTVNHENKMITFYYNGMCLPHDFDEIQQLTLKNWLIQEAKNYLPQRLQECAQQCRWVLVAPNLKIKWQRSRWGSCSSLGNINLNAKLMQLDLTKIDAVIFHELCHLKEMNHSVRFYALLAQVYPEYKNFNIPL